MKFEIEYVNLVNEVIADIGDFDLIVNEETNPINRPTSKYLNDHRHEYIRTVQDVAQYLPHGARVLEIGAFFGTVSISLSRLGFELTASDIPEYMSLPEQKARFSQYGVHTASIRLQDYTLPFKDNSFDAVIMCEVLEHLNFNPLPLLKDINRILSNRGLLYLSLPNLAKISNRLSLLRGQSIQVSVESFFKQLDPDEPEIANGHWREYTMKDIQIMLTKLGFSIDSQYYFSLSECQNNKSLRKRLGRAFYKIFPQFKENQTTLAIKDHRTDFEFVIPATVHPTLSKF